MKPIFHPDGIVICLLLLSQETSQSWNIICVDYVTNNITQTLTLDSGVSNPSAHTFQWFEDGMPIVGSNSSTYTVNTPSLTGG